MDKNETVTGLSAPAPAAGVGVRVAHIDLTVYTLDIDYTADAAGTAHFALWRQGVHTANAALGAVSVTADGRIAPALNEVAARIGLGPEAADTARLLESLTELAALFGSVQALIGTHMRLEPGAYRVLRELQRRESVTAAAPTRTAPVHHLPAGAAT